MGRENFDITASEAQIEADLEATIRVAQEAASALPRLKAALDALRADRPQTKERTLFGPVPPLPDVYKVVRDHLADGRAHRLAKIVDDVKRQCRITVDYKVFGDDLVKDGVAKHTGRGWYVIAGAKGTQ